MVVMGKLRMIRTYSELVTFPTFEERYKYLKLDGVIGEDTFGFDRYLNQKFYHSSIWRRIREDVILRDNGCDLATPGYDIVGHITIHHLAPITKEDIIKQSEFLLNPEFLVCVSDNTHKAIHYGDERKLVKNQIITRTANDTCPWRK